ncbi:hypothetical protein SAMN05421810_103310 [Amycolatopsis arida]|uniref:Uncharacterized protein n=1 Tax=Amycolatopsis arida TaxID=587909 RepID=A0A1I5SXH7_9PSEU|nr:hypothetical protein [Amycolatopsis arida]TDX96311.1 hypothetical protein CLV69_103448 [Amycolatopsis arida]SFP75418.1 hypothetical protein SAMN05421810_103310 [Amycolatopsis arida]
MTTDHSSLSRELCLHTLAQHVREDRPRLFAIYGLHHGRPLDVVCGWGMEWEPEYGGAIFYDPENRTIWRADSAQRLLVSQQRIAEARLVRFDNGTMET